MEAYRTVLIIGVIEILIGGLTLFGNFISILLDTNHKSPNVLLFVIIAGSVSTLIGIGMLKFNKAAYYLLLYFSSVIILSKILIFWDVIQLNGALEAVVPNPVKSLISISYHGFVIYYLTRPNIKQIFHY